MRVLFSTTSFPRHDCDHRSPFLLEAAKTIKALGCNVCVLAMHIPGCKPNDHIAGIQVARPKYLPERFELLQKDRSGLPGLWKQNKLLLFLVVPYFIVHSLHSARMGRKVDLIHTHWTLAGLAALISKPIHKKPIVVTVHGSDLFQAIKNPCIRYLTGVLLRRVNHVVAVSHQLAKTAKELGVSEHRVSVIPNGVDIEKFSFGSFSRKPIVLFVGSLTENKGVHHLIEIFPSIAKHNNNVQLVIIGDGPNRNYLERLSKNLDVNNKVIFTGNLNNDQVAWWMRQAMVLVLPSHSEGLGVVLLEALASGTPVVGSCVGGIPDIISSDVGILVNPTDSISLQKAITDILSDSTLFQSMSIAGRQKAEKVYDWIIVGRKILLIYESLLEERK